MSLIKPVNSQTHKHIHVTVDNRFALAKGQHLIPLLLSEYEVAGAEFPLVFVKDHETGQIRSAAMTGLRPGENLFYSDAGWRASYVPASLRTSPFSAATSNDDEKLIVCIDEHSELLNDQTGEALFTERGDETEYLMARGQLAAQFHEHHKLTDAFITALTDVKLIKSNVLTVKVSDKEHYELNGIYGIDKDRLQALPDEDFLSLRKAGYLPAIYALLSSMNRVNSLLHMKAITDN